MTSALYESAIEDCSSKISEILHEIVMSQNIYKFSIVFGGYIKKKMEELNSPQCARRAIVMVKQRWQWSVIGWVIKTL
jgi:hypothetical protein